jgi:hypothetical protein
VAFGGNQARLMMRGAGTRLAHGLRIGYHRPPQQNIARDSAASRV